MNVLRAQRAANQVPYWVAYAVGRWHRPVPCCVLRWLTLRDKDDAFGDGILRLRGRGKRVA